MDLWWRFRGWARLRVTSADCAGRLRELAQGIRLEDVRFVNELTGEFTISLADLDRVQVREGENLEILACGGLPVQLKRLRRWWMAAAMVVLLSAMTVFLQGRMLFFRVEGNDRLPARLILERVAECGVYFGAHSTELRSERVKNHLLWAIPELRWAGVNVHGCNVVITVAERQTEEAAAEDMPGNIHAVVDGMVTAVFPERGTVLVSPGQTVCAGDVLISGFTDVGLLVRSDRAAGEVYGLTRRSVEAVLPEKTVLRHDDGVVKRKFSLRIGKKYVNFSNDSGILHGTCVKMRTVNYLKLPGGVHLPVALVTDTYRLCTTEPISREMDAELLMEQVRRIVREEMTAGTILREERKTAGNRLLAVLHCREMIGVFRPETITEGDTNDRENCERGAG